MKTCLGLIIYGPRAIGKSLLAIKIARSMFYKVDVVKCDVPDLKITCPKDTQVVIVDNCKIENIRSLREQVLERCPGVNLIFCTKDKPDKFHEHQNYDHFNMWDFERRVKK
jgi:hypothetical protein